MNDRDQEPVLVVHFGYPDDYHHTWRDDVADFAYDVWPDWVPLVAFVVMAATSVAAVLGLSWLGWTTAHAFNPDWAATHFPIRPFLYAAVFVALTPRLFALIRSSWSDEMDGAQQHARNARDNRTQARLDYLAARDETGDLTGPPAS